MRHIAALAVAELFAMTLWFSATAVLPALTTAWSLSPGQAAWMTAAVQVGFVIGALVAAFFNLPDVIPPRRMFAVSAVAGAGLSVILATVVDSAGPAIVVRFLTGVALAGVYPPGMKIAAGHVRSQRRGLAIAIIVGALTLGSATPHLIAGIFDGIELSYSAVLLASAVLSIVAAFVVLVAVDDGPYGTPPAPFDPGQAMAVLRNRPVFLANVGYLGHMWELYAMWTWLAAFLGTVVAVEGRARLVAFIVIGVAGAAGALLGGWFADRRGRTVVTILAMVISGSCCLMTPWIHGASAVIVVSFGLVWGASIVADSAQFSAAVTELALPEYMGTALTLQTSLGFALTLIPIWAMPYLAEAVGWQYAFVFLAVGPVVGIAAMWRLRAHPDATKMAAGRR